MIHLLVVANNVEHVYPHQVQRILALVIQAGQDHIVIFKQIIVNQYLAIMGALVYQH